ncbi:MAG: helix-turn-helix domain-containing protein [Ignavibacteria bacterium]|jgi:transcriptional regulator with XRE-family HTH domain|nr:helix-turn-helix domain-containing protein [Ignavibacteria bacterium]
MSSNKSDEKEIEKRMENLLSFENNAELEDFDEIVFHLRVMNEIKDLLKKKNWNKKKLAEELGTSQSYISQLFSANKLINTKLIGKLERLLNVRFTIKIEELSEEAALIQKESSSFKPGRIETSVARQLKKPARARIKKTVPKSH